MFFGLQDWLFWLIVAGLALVVEIATVMLVSVWFVLGGMVAALAALAGLSEGVQLTLMVVVSLASFLISLSFRDKLKIGRRYHQATNADALIGRHAVLQEPIDGLTGSGTIKLDGLVWSVKLESEEAKLPAGTSVRILAIEGVKLLVEAIDQPGQ